MDTTTQVQRQTAQVSFPTNCDVRTRRAIALQLDPRPLPRIPFTVDAELMPYLPDAGASVESVTPAQTEEREGLVAPHTVTRGQGNVAVVTFSLPPPGSIGRVETVLWREFGVACVRAVNFLLQWRKLRYWKEAASVCGVDQGTINSWCDASPTYRALHDAFRAGIMSTRHQESEDTLHKLANGEIEARKDALTKDGDVVSLSQGAIYSEKALALALAAGNPQLYGNAKGVSGAVSVAIQINIPPPPQRVTVERTVSATPEPEDAEYCEA